MVTRSIVIMAGGRGERFWPQSRLSRPKHLLPIVGDKPMLVQAIDRVRGLVAPERIWVITNREQRDAVREVCPFLLPDRVVGEPVGRDTAAAVGLASVLASAEGDHTFAILPADHVIHDHEAFREDLDRAFALAESGDRLVTVGIRPTYPATGYGYIHQGDPIRGPEGGHEVRRFVEKPDEATAGDYLASGEYFWNAGMFVWRPSVIRRELAANTPKLEAALQRIEKAVGSGEDLDRILDEVYPDLEKISIDYAVMEKAGNVAMIESTFDWDDVGEWPAVSRHSEPDGRGNTVRGEVVQQDADDNILIAGPGQVLAVVGIRDLIVVQTPDATLVCPKDRAQEIKKLVARLGDLPDGSRFQ